MNISCNVVRDLIPLVIDGVASTESTEMANEHLGICPECRSFYEAMKSETKIPENHTETGVFDLAIKKMKRKRSRRVVRNILAGVLAGAALLYGVFCLFPQTRPKAADPVVDREPFFSASTTTELLLNSGWNSPLPVGTLNDIASDLLLEKADSDNDHEKKYIWNDRILVTYTVDDNEYITTMLVTVKGFSSDGKVKQYSNQDVLEYICQVMKYKHARMEFDGSFEIDHNAYDGYPVYRMWDKEVEDSRTLENHTAYVAILSDEAGSPFINGDIQILVIRNAGGMTPAEALSTYLENAELQ